LLEGLTLLQKSIGKEHRPLSWVVGDQGVYKAPKPSQRDAKRDDRKRMTLLRPPDKI
ncbi:MAG: NADH-quinone oxidoreductase subunit B, partial [Nevskiales bacterium]